MTVSTPSSTYAIAPAELTMGGEIAIGPGVAVGGDVGVSVGASVGAAVDVSVGGTVADGVRDGVPWEVGSVGAPDVTEASSVRGDGSGGESPGKARSLEATTISTIPRMPAMRTR
jgi:hypothetical protein